MHGQPQKTNLGSAVQGAKKDKYQTPAPGQTSRQKYNINQNANNPQAGCR